MSTPERMRYETFVLGGAELDDGIVHLRSRLPEVVALGTEAALEFKHHASPLGGPHAQWVTEVSKPAKLVVETPECSFAYQVVGIKQDAAGWYFLMKRIYVSDAYHAWVETL